jgi:large subunit ribosomal protein L19e
MRLTLQRRLAAQIFTCSPKRVWFDDEKINEIKEAITKEDIKDLIREGAIRAKPIKSISRGRARKIHTQKTGGKRKGHGSRKGRAGARLPRKESWMLKIRVQRKFLQELKAHESVTIEDYHDLYKKSKGGFFRSTRHMKLYMEEHGLFKKKK